jgi:uncharacterized membrane protein
MPRPDEVKGFITRKFKEAQDAPEMALVARITTTVLALVSAGLGAWQFVVFRRSQLDGCDEAMKFVLVSAASHASVVLAFLCTFVTLREIKVGKPPPAAKCTVCLYMLIGLFRLATSIWAIILFASFHDSDNACRAEWDAVNSQVWHVVQAEFAIFFCFVVVESCSVCVWFSLMTFLTMEQRKVVADGVGLQ